MKYLVLFLLCFNCVSCIPHITNDKSNFTNDKILNQVKEILPEGWFMSVKDDLLVIERTDSVWSYLENKMNADGSIYPVKEEDKLDYIKSSGRKIKCHFTYVIEKKWTDKKLMKVVQYNDSVYKEISGLDKKYGLEELFKRPSKDGNYTRYMKSEEVINNFKKYNEEKKELQLAIKKVPDGNTEFYSLFFKSSDGMEDAFTSIYPAAVSQEMYIFKPKLDKLLN